MAVYTARMNTFYGMNTIIELSMDQVSSSSKTNSTKFSYTIKIKRVNNWNDNFKGNAAIWFNVGGQQILDNKRATWTIHGADHGHLINAEDTLQSGTFDVKHNSDGTKTANISLLVDPNVSNAIDGAWDSREQMRIEKSIVLKSIPKNIPVPPPNTGGVRTHRMMTYKAPIGGRGEGRWVDSDVKKHVGGYGWMPQAVRASVSYKNGTLWSALKTSMDAPEYSPRMQSKQITWSANWGQSYDKDGNSISAVSSLNKLQQGISDNFGIRRSMIGFDYDSMQDNLNNTRITKVELFLYLEESDLTGAIASIGSHKRTSKPDTFSYWETIQEVKFTKPKQGMWVELPLIYGVKLAKGDIVGLTLFKNTDNSKYSGTWSGYEDPNPPKIRITYDVPVGGIEFDADFEGIVKNTSEYFTASRSNLLPYPSNIMNIKNIVRKIMDDGLLEGDWRIHAELMEQINRVMVLNGYWNSSSIVFEGQKIRYK